MMNKFTSEGWPNNIGKLGKLVFPDKKVRNFKIIDEIYKKQSSNPHKVIYLQLVQFEDNPKERELRLCYYIIGKIGRTKGKWVFGQFATLVPAKDFQIIIDEAKKRNWF